MPTLYLIPSPISNPISLPEYIRDLKWIIVENLREARRFLRATFSDFPIDETRFLEINKNQLDMNAIRQFLKKAKDAKMDVGLLSDAGVPCVADPGSQVVEYAHLIHFTVKPLVGPSSILLALMASGFNGQQFAFHGYLPIQEAAQKQALLELETESKRKHQTQLFIETPYRNNKLLENLIKTLHPSTRLCIAADLESESEEIASMSIADWKNQKRDFHKRPAVFLLYAH